MRSQEPWLPLSWSAAREPQLQQPEIQSYALPFSAVRWLAFGRLPQHYTPLCLTQWLSQRRQPYVLRGCHPRLLQALQAPARQSLLSGREALLDLHLPHFERRSLCELARRGHRQGEVHELTLAEVLANPLYEAFLAQVRRPYAATLRGLYRLQLQQSQRFWVLAGSQIQALVALVPTGPGSWHTELLLRQPQAPVGVMEALLQAVFQQLQAEGERYWSLGEVPFFPTSPPLGLQACSLNRIGQRISFAYQAQGLYHFKHKFRPLWRPVYLYASPRLAWSTLAALCWQSRCQQLVWKQACRLAWPPGDALAAAESGKKQPLAGDRDKSKQCRSFHV